jgi:hypothetical protein
VDDLIIVCLADNLFFDFEKAFGSIFNVQYFGSVSWLLGMTVERDRNIRIIKIG